MSALNDIDRYDTYYRKSDGKYVILDKGMEIAICDYEDTSIGISMALNFVNRSPTKYLDEINAVLDNGAAEQLAEEVEMVETGS